MLYEFVSCPICRRPGRGKTEDMCDGCYTKHIIGYRVSSNGLEFRVETAVKETNGWWIFKTETVTWKPVDKNGDIQDYTEPYFDDDYDIEYYGTIEDAKEALNRFVKEKKDREFKQNPTVKIISRMSEWKPV